MLETHQYDKADRRSSMKIYFQQTLKAAMTFTAVFPNISWTSGKTF